MPKRRPHTTLSYSEARARLYSLEHWGIKLGLQNIAEFCAHLGDPHKRYLAIHVAGTNGKGSTSAFLESILRRAGYSVGRYTSPHLRDFRERIHIDGRPVPAAWVSRFVAHHWDRITKAKYSYFEVTTALAFDAFARAEVDLAVVEVGLGGRFDATNIIAPLISVITRIARDHEHVLGHTPGEVAFEKAGIVKDGTPAVIGPLLTEAEDMIRSVAKQRGAPLYSAAEVLAWHESKQVMPKSGETWRVPLVGTHQTTNLATALAAVSLLQVYGMDISASVIRRGIEQTKWPARFQIVRGAPTVVYDAAHNPDGIRAVVETWKRTYGEHKCVCLFNTRTDKNYAEMIAAVAPIVEHWVGCPLPGAPGISEAEMRALGASYNLSFAWQDTPKGALQKARMLAGRHGRVLVTGSHYLVGAIIPPRVVAGSAESSTSVPISRPQLLAAAQDRGDVF